MPQNLTITTEEILTQIKLSGKIPDMVDKVIRRHIIEKAILKAGIKAENGELQEAADKFRLINQLESAEQTWGWLEKHNLSLDDFERIVSMNLLTNKLIEHMFNDKVASYFFEHQLDYAGAIIYEIVLDDQDLVQELFYAIREGEISFYDVAHQYIQHPELRRKGGYQGIVRRKDIKPEISAAVFAAKPPQVLKPIVTSIGVHLILVEEIIQAQLDDQLHEKIASDLFTEWLKEETMQVEFNLKLD